jgi:predicted CoA-binding protein
MTFDRLADILNTTRTIAVVGASIHPEKAGHSIPSYLQTKGYKIVPVNPTHEEVLGEKSYPSLLELDGPVDMVDVFRPSEDAARIAREAVQIGVKVIWFQPGTESDEGVAIAEQAGLTVVTDACTGVVRRLMSAAS